MLKTNRFPSLQKSLFKLNLHEELAKVISSTVMKVLFFPFTFIYCFCSIDDDISCFAPRITDNNVAVMMSASFLKVKRLAFNKMIL